MDDQHNPEFVGNEEKFKYISVHGYEKFQADYKTGKLVDGSRLYIKDSCRKDSDLDYSALTITQRYTLDGLRRLTGLHGKWPKNDPLAVVRGLSVIPKERHCVSKAIRRLVQLGLLDLSNVQLNSQEVVEVVKKEEELTSTTQVDDISLEKLKTLEPEPVKPDNQPATDDSRPEESYTARMQREKREGIKPSPPTNVNEKIGPTAHVSALDELCAVCSDDEQRRAVRYLYNRKDKEGKRWYRDNLTVAMLKSMIAKGTLLEKVPPGAVKPDTRLLPDVNCPKCKGDGRIKVPGRKYEEIKHLQKTSPMEYADLIRPTTVVCDCLFEQDPNEWQHK